MIWRLAQRPASGYSQSEAKVTTSMGPFFGHFQSRYCHAALIGKHKLVTSFIAFDEMNDHQSCPLLSNLYATVHQANIQYDIINPPPLLCYPPSLYLRDIFLSIPLMYFCFLILIFHSIFTSSFLHLAPRSSKLDFIHELLRKHYFDITHFLLGYVR